MAIRLVSMLTVLFLGAAPAFAQSPTGPEYIAAAQLQQAVADTGGPPQSALMFKKLGERSTYNYWIVKRDSTGQVERHADWSDVFIVQSGKGTVLYGGQLEGGRETAPGETLGGEITGGMRQSLAMNDIMIIPAGMPHQVWVEPGQSITYVILKVKRQPDAETK